MTIFCSVVVLFLLASRSCLGDSETCASDCARTAPGVPLLQVRKEHSTQLAESVQCAPVMHENAAHATGIQNKPLAFDVGLYNGRDTMELLRKGHRVVAVEANPVMYNRSMRIFSKFIRAGMLTLVNGVLSKDSKVKVGTTLPFYVRKGKKNQTVGEWNSLMKGVACRKSYQNHTTDMSTCDALDVEVVSCAGLIKKYGSPYFMKLDIEGHEMSCLRELKVLANESNGLLSLPQYVSMEANYGTKAFLPSLERLGYGKVKMVDQGKFGDWSGPYGDLAQDIKSGLQWNDIATFEIPQCPSWCDFHMSFGPAPSTATSKVLKLDGTAMEAEVSVLAKAAGLV